MDLGQINPILLDTFIAVVFAYVLMTRNRTRFAFRFIGVSAIQLFQGMLLFFLLAMDVFANFRVRIRRAEVAS